MCADLTNPAFTDEDEARKFLEASRWPDGPVCPFCGQMETVSKLGGKSMGPGWYFCNDCRDKFTVRVGTLYERSHIPLHKWLLATHLMVSSKKGVSAHQLHRILGITYKSAWFMAHRIREAMAPKKPTPIGGNGKWVEADESFVGGKAINNAFGDPPPKQAVFALVERQGEVRSYHVANIKASTFRPYIVKITSRDSILMTDEGKWYTTVGREFDHGRKEYVRGEAHTNTVEGYFSLLKRGINGIYHHVSEAHLHRYLAEFDFRYNTRTKLGVSDAERAAMTLKGIEGKRLTYRASGNSQVQ
jgi:transposase-like protein